MGPAMSWVLFRSPDLGTAWQFIQIMAGEQGGLDRSFFAALWADSLFLTELTVGLVLALPIYRMVCRLSESMQQRDFSHFGLVAAESSAALGRVTLFAGLLYFVLITIAAQAYHPFLYFQF